MDSTPFIESFQEINDSFIKLIESLSALRGLSIVRMTGQTDRQLLEQALGVLMQNQDMERCAIYLPEGEELVNVAGLCWSRMIGVQADADLPGVSLSSERVVPGEGVVGQAYTTGMAQYCNNCHRNPELCTSCCGESAEQFDIGSMLCLPMMVNDEVLGVLAVSHPHLEFFTQAHRHSLAIFAGFLAQMLMNNRLLSNMEKLVAERTLQLEQMLNKAEVLKQRYAQLAVIDELTGLHNRRFFFPEAETAVARCLRYRHEFCLLLMDIDHFKNINDMYGHQAGDVALKNVAKQLGKLVRNHDIIARFGGEEFILALPDTELSGAKMLAERIRKQIGETTILLDRQPVRLTVSIGISTLPDDFKGSAREALDRLIREADQALYFGKSSGRNMVSFYEEISRYL